MSDPKTDAGFRQHVLERRFTIVQQPVIDLETRKPIHVEWLVRFDADESLEGLLRPAEISGAIAALDITMLKQAIRTLNLDKRRQPIAVNLSGASMEGPGFETQLFSALDTLTGDPSRLMLELTESWDLRDLSVTADILKTVRQRGHETCLDDVGAGAASIRYLRAFETDWLKIDGEFIQAAMTSPRDLAILKAVLSLKSVLKVKIIAEGLEDDSHVEFARSLGCEAGQGYALGRPVREPLRGF